MYAQNVIDELVGLGSPERSEQLAWFFKTGPGQYGEGDRFLGVTVPKQRGLIKEYISLSFGEIEKLLDSEFHECRLTALLILVAKFNKGSDTEKRVIYDFYMSNTKNINNWDLVDLSATYIVGPVLGRNYKNTLFRLAKSENIWERRIAMLSCFWYIKNGTPGPAFDVIEILKNDKHDLIQKAVGWMLREIGKRCDKQILVDWLNDNDQYKKLPRTTLRYAIEHFPEAERRDYLVGNI